MLKSADAVGYLIAAQGSSALAAQRARQELGLTDLTEARFLYIIASDPMSFNALANQMRLLLMMQVLQSLKVTEMAYLEKLDNLSPSSVAKTYTDLIKTIVLLCGDSSSQSSPNTLASIMTALPPQIREAFQGLLTDELESELTVEPGSARPPAV